MTINKASVFIRKVGATDSNFAFKVKSEANVAFSAANFASLTQASNYVVFVPAVTGSHHSGSLRVFPSTVSTDFPYITYPISAEQAGKHFVYFRVKKTGIETAVSLNVFINDIYQNSLDSVIPVDAWAWIVTEIIIKDDKQFNFTIQPSVSNLYIDTIVVTKETNLPSELIYESSFQTVHCKLFSVTETNTVIDSLNFYSSKNTITDIISDDWYNFELTPLPGFTQINYSERYALGLFVSGASESSYVMWDFAIEQDAANTCILNYNETTSTWELDCSQKFAVRYFTPHDALDVVNGKIIIPPATSIEETIEQFESQNLQASFLQTEIVDVSQNSNKVALKLSDRLVCIVIDQSGSQTWNDNPGLRHTMTRRMVDRLESTYPGEVRYTLLSFGGTPIEIDFFAVVETEEINTSSVTAVASQFFADQESGYAGVRIVRKLGSYPETPLDGDLVTEGLFRKALDENLDTGEEYYYAAYTYNQDGVFSDGKFLKVTPREKILPRGAGNFTYRVVTGTGVRRDQNTVGLWHCNEEDGNILYDFSNSNNVLTANKTDLLWLDTSDVPWGTSGLRLDGATYFTSSAKNDALFNQQMTVMAWVFPFNFAQERNIITRESAVDNKIAYKFGIDAAGFLYLTLDGNVFAKASTPLQAAVWQHVAVAFDVDLLIASFYVDGDFVGTAVLATGPSFDDAAANIYVAGKNNNFFGKLNEISVHNVIRSDNYINSYASIPSSNAFKILDNGDRLVILRYLISDDYNYVGGSNFIVSKESIGVANFKYDEPISTGPTSEVLPDAILRFDGFGEGINNEFDGQTIYSENASSGEKILSLPSDYVHERIYNYRLYSKNALGNTSDDSNSAQISVEIPAFENINARDLAIPTPFLSAVTNVQVTPGNAKLYITWDSVEDDDVAQIKVFWSDRGSVIIDENSQVSKSAICVFSGNKTSTGFVDRNIENSTVNFYAIVSVDKYGNFSAAYHFEGVPVVDADESIIPLLEVKNFRYDIVRDDAISLSWDSPVKFQRDIEAYFDERIVLYAQITDEYGAPLSDVSNIKFTINASIDSGEIAEDVFTENINAAQNFTVKDTYVATSTVLGNGIIKGIFRMTTNPEILSAINYLRANITVSYFIPDRNDSSQNVFELYSSPLRLKMYNPFGMELVNVGSNTGNYGDPEVSNTFIKKSRRRNSKTLQDLVVEENNSDNTSRGQADLVRISCKQVVPLQEPGFIASGGTTYNAERYKDFDGCFVRRRRPYVARVVVTYKNQPLPQGASCNVAVFEASDPQCDPDENETVNPCVEPSEQTSPQPFVPTYSTIRSRSVRPPATSLEMILGRQTLPDGTTRFVSYVDVPLPAPASPQAVMFFAKVNFANLNSRRKSYIVFANILRIETTIEPPQSDCVDVVEQFANVFLIDPDSREPLRPDLRRLPVDVPVRWELKKGFGAKDRPFYSSDNVPTGPGIFSYARNGTARKVFFGPACGVDFSLYRCQNGVLQLPEVYAIRASVVHDGLRDFEERPAIIYPQRANSTGFGDRFLLSLPNYYNPLYADGYSYLKGTIYHDPNIDGGYFGGCFLECAERAGKTIFALDSGQVIDIDSGDAFEIFYGDDIELEYDSDLDETLIKNGTQAFGFAQIPLSTTSTHTDFYVRINKFIQATSDSSLPPRENVGRNVNLCDCVDLPAGLLNKQGLPFVRGTTTINYNGEILYLRAGGDFKTGIPPTAIDLREPLAIFMRDIRRNGVSVEEFTCDGVSIHEIIIELSFKEKPVPNGTPIFVAVGGKNPERIVLQNEVVYTEKRVDLALERLGLEKSYASLFVLPLNSDTSFEAQIRFESNYDKRGDAERSASTCLTIKFDVSTKKPEPEEIIRNVVNNIYDNNLEVYDTFNNSWIVKSNMQQARGCLSLCYILDMYGESILATGGMNGKSILGDVEMYDVASDIWTQKAAMNIPRFYHQTAFDGNYVYVFGGITTRENNLEITRIVERYDIAADMWETVTPMPIFDQNPYGVALGTATVVDSKVYIVGGITRIGNKGSIDALNDRVLVFDFDTLTWSYSNPYTGIEFDAYCRIAPFVFANSNVNVINVIGGAQQKPINTETGEQELVFPTDSIEINLSNYELSFVDYKFTQIPQLRYRGAAVSIVDQHFFLGGTSKKQNVTNIVERISEQTPASSYNVLADMPVAKTSFGCVTDGLQYIYVAGGLNSGRPKGFLQIKTDVNPITIRLDGKQSGTLKIELLNDVGERPSQKIRVLVQGILVFPSEQGADATGGDVAQQTASDSALKDALIYPVIFSNFDFDVQNGIGSTILLPRSDDILKKIDEIKKALGITSTIPGEGGSDGIGPLVITEGKIRFPYKIQIRLTIIDSFFYGQTVVDVKDNEDETVIATTSNPTQTEATDTEVINNQNPTNPNTGNVNFEGCTLITANNVIVPSGNETAPQQGRTQENRRTIDRSLQENDNPVFDLSPPQTPQLPSAEISYFNDKPWLPQTKILIEQGTYSEVYEKLRIIRNDIPYGGSPLYDALQKMAEISSDESLDIYVKSFYINTDNEQNMSFATLDESLESIQAIDGYGRVPCIINNFSVVFPLTLSALVARTDFASFERFAKETGGQSQTVIDEDSISVVLNNSIGRLQGSIGYGLYECTVDLGQNSIVNSIGTAFELYSNTDGNWSISTSVDGYSFTELSDTYNANELITLNDFNARYIKFKVVLLSGLSASIDDEYELIPTPGVPALTQLKINYSQPTISYIYLNQDSLLHSAQQIAVSVSANKPKLSTIEVGASSGNTYSWKDYNSGSQDTIERFGKIFIPIRYKQTHDEALNEPLDYVNGFVYRARYGRWDHSASVAVYDEKNAPIDSALYDLYPDDGLVVFKKRQITNFTIAVENSGKLRVALKITNNDAFNTVELDGLGYMYNTNVFLPPALSQRPPTLTDFKITPQQLFIYEKISLSYKYFDINNNPEVTEEAEIKWYINGVEVQYLRNLRTWNDITNINDPLWIYGFTFTPTDVPDNTTADLFAREKGDSILKVDDIVYATIRVSDGNGYSDVYRTQSIKITANPPIINAVVIKGLNNNGQLQDNVTATTRAIAEFGFFADEKTRDKQKSQIVWYVNGVEFKRGNLNETVNGISNNEIIQGETVGNVVGIQFGNILQVIITPIANNIVGVPVISEEVTVQNDPPRVSNVVLSPNPVASVTSSLRVTFTYTDRESQQTGSQQSNQSSTRWYKANRGSSAFTEVSSLQNATLITSVNLSSGQKWKVEVIPFDGFDTGTPVQSNVVEIV